jgi:hypothetical protein
MTQYRHAKVTHLIYEKRAKTPKKVNKGIAFPVSDLLAAGDA